MFPVKPAKTRLFLITLLAVLVFNVVLVPTARAQAPGVPVLVTEDIPELRGEVKKTIGGAIAASIFSGLQYFLNKIAYDTATWLASGGKGQQPMWLTKAGIKEVGENVAGEAIGALGDNIEFLRKYGISLCVPPEPQFQLWLKLGLAETINPPKPRCNFKQIKEAWSRVNPLSGSFDPDAWRGVGVGLRPGQNDLSVALQSSVAIADLVGIKQQEEIWKYQFKGEAKAPETKVSEEATGPKATVKKTAEELSPAEKKKETEIQALTFMDMADTGTLTAVVLNASKIFVNTLAKKLMDKYLKGGGLFTLADLLQKDKTGAAGSPEAQAPPGGRQAAEAAFAEFLTPKLQEIENYPYLDKPEYQGILDANLRAALALPESLTVAEAMKSYLHPEWKLKAAGEPCDSQSYCYSNLVKLRQLRVLPIGWEMAAQLSKTQRHYTLKEAMAGFNTAGGSFEHLIDPNWLLKAPIAKCGAEAYGVNFLAEPSAEFSGQRDTYCADIQNCVAEDEQGGCPSAGWGYCLAEKNIWRLGADSCDEQYNTCTTYADSTGKSVSYLANTIDKGICSADNAGCRAYATSSIFSNNQWEWQAGSANPKIYFDNDVEQCDYSQEGCSGFVRTFGHLIGGEDLPDEPLNLKKAPDYYHCYDGIKNATDFTSFSSSSLPWWPVNKADLSKLAASLPKQNQEACKKFASVCGYDEVGCELYSPTDGTTPIPGILTENDLCPSECVGYESFKQQKTNFDPPAGGFVYFIPSRAIACQSNYAGCDEFINLEKQTAGGESKEYYKELRACSQNAADGAVYYTWEGSDTAGYQLKSYTLKALKALKTLDSLKLLNTLDSYTADENAPAYNTDNEENLIDYLNSCSAGLYKAHTAEPDCREFYDKDGNKSYRLYSKTVTVSATECKKLRKVETQNLASAETQNLASLQASCTTTGGDWDEAQKICVYLAIPAEGQSCPANQNGCRAYKGNAGHNFQIIYSEYFEGEFEGRKVGQNAEPETGWDGKFSAESTVVGGKSLKVETRDLVETQNFASLHTFPWPQNTTYLISFWAKGVSPGLEVKFYSSDAVGNSVGTEVETQNFASLQSDWRNYTAGPFTVTWDPSTASTTLKFSSANVFYLDNIVVKRINDDLSVIKDSWKTPSSCDNLYEDPIGFSQGGSEGNPYRLLPQAMLGCQEYANRANQEVTVKSFSQMCREEAVGCEEFVDTFNTDTTDVTYVNVLCELYVGTDNVKNTSNQAVSCKDKNGQERCLVPSDQKSCRFTFIGDIGQQAGDMFSDLSGGTTKDTANKEYSVYIGQDSQTIIISADRPVYLVSDSKHYCADDNLGCQALGPISYDKEGQATSTTSVYRKNQPEKYVNNNTPGILCEKAAEGCDQFATTQGGMSYFKDPEVLGNVCKWKAKANSFNPDDINAQWVEKNNDLNGCYPNFKIRRVGDIGYDNKIGLCPPDQNGCSEFIDPADTSEAAEHPEGVPYYVINNDKLNRRDCGNQVSLQEGCVLFDETSQGMKLWSAASTYQASQENNNQRVNPVEGERLCDEPAPDLSCPLDVWRETSDSNLILKVKRDRVCGQWLACKSAMKVPRLIGEGGWKDVCTELAVCDQANVSEDMLGRCGHWAEEDDIRPKPGFRWDITSTNLKTNYRLRDVSWWGKDYSGYSVPDAYGIADLSVGAYDNNTPSSLIGPVDTDKAVFSNGTAIPETCRGYADADAPDKFSDGSAGLPGLRSAEAGACSFTKVDYSAKGGSQTITQYYPFTKLLGGEGVCDGGVTADFHSKKGASCQSSADCRDERGSGVVGRALAVPEDGVCLLTKEVVQRRGWEGYCLDPSVLSPPYEGGAQEGVGVKKSQCNLWYPLSTPSGSVSLDNLFQTAGYVPPIGSGKYWCVQGKGNANRTDGAAANLNTSYRLVVYSEARSSHWTAQDATMFPRAYDSGFTGHELFSPPLSRIHISELAAIGIKPKGWGRGADTSVPGAGEAFIFRDQALPGLKYIDNEAGKEGRYWSGPLEEKENALVLEWVWSYTTKPPAPRFKFEDIKSGFKENMAAQGVVSIIGLRAVFDQNGMLANIQSRVLGDDYFITDLVFYLTEVCTDIRQTVQEDDNSPLGFSAKARTDRVWANSKYLLGKDVHMSIPGPLGGTIELGMDLKYDQLFAPFGSFNQGADPSTTAGQSGYWPIWMAPGGATPLNCAGEKGDCGLRGLCKEGTKINQKCNPSIASGQDNGCGKNIKEYSCTPNWTMGVRQRDTCSGGPHDGEYCDSDKYCEEDLGYYACQPTSEPSGLCVGGLNHGLACGSAKDCPEKKYTDAAEEVIGYGVCVGASLDKGKTIPVSTAFLTDPSRLTEFGRLHELFVWLSDGWSWNAQNNGKYDEVSDAQNLDFSNGSQSNIITPTPPRLYSLKTAANNPKVGFTWGAQNAVTVMGLDKLPKDSGVIQAGSGSFPAVIKFFAYADNDQMPLTRMSIDWDDGPDDPATRSVIERQNVYTVKGWFKNRKPWCDGTGWKVCGNGGYLNIPCSSNNDCQIVGGNCQVPLDNRLHFGNSFDACATGYYQFTHLYTCKKNGPGWNQYGAVDACRFKPKVQVLDNWGWCNASFSGSPPQNCQDFVGGAKGCWQGEGKTTCDTTKSEPWTAFAGTIEIKP